MLEPVSVAQLKVQLRLGAGGDEDGHLENLIRAARRSIENLTNQVIAGDDPTLPEEDAPQAAHAILMLAAHWYDHRGGTADVPPAVKALAQPLRRFRPLGVDDAD